MRTTITRTTKKRTTTMNTMTAKTTATGPDNGNWVRHAKCTWSSYSCLACCGILEMFQKYSTNILQISEKYWEFVRKKCRELCCLFCDALFQGGISKALLWRGDRTLLHFNINIEQEAFQLEVGLYCAFTLHLDVKIEQEATQEFENAHS